MGRQAERLARRLIYIQIIHSPSDLGSVADQLQTVGEETLTVAGWRRHQKSVAAFWEELRRELIARLEKELPGGEWLGPCWSRGRHGGPPLGGPSHWDKLHIYQDGMPVGGEDAKRIADEVAAAGSPNYQLVKDLLARGAQAEQTEDPRLLREEYELARRLAAAQGPVEQTQAAEAYRQRSGALLAARDAFIAQRIDETLKQGELGVLFIGALHRVRSYLPADIEIILLP
jgi:hypothetical protein